MCTGVRVRDIYYDKLDIKIKIIISYIIFYNLIL